MKKKTFFNRPKIVAASKNGGIALTIGFALTLAGCQSNSTSVDYQENGVAAQGGSDAYDREDLLRSGGTRAYSSKYESIGIFEFHHTETTKSSDSKYFMVSENNLMPGN